ncbi:MAG TPA: hypothetical protein VIM22_06915, partial [Solirubrobacteraceae bacterium]
GLLKADRPLQDRGVVVRGRECVARPEQRRNAHGGKSQAAACDPASHEIAAGGLELPDHARVDVAVADQKLRGYR